jgi:hypothetical protein
MKDLEKQNSILTEKEDDLVKREKEYLKKLDIMENHEQAILSKLEEKRKRLKKQEKELKQRERMLHKKQRNVDKRAISMEYAEEILEEEKGKLLDDQFENYLAESLGGVRGGTGLQDMNIVSNLELKQQHKKDSLYQLIDTCKDLVTNNKITEAKVFYNQIREKYYDKEFSDTKEKEAVHNLIRALYDEINLAEIGRNR